MNIDFYKLLQLLTPTFLRGGMTVLFSALVSPFNSIYADFKLWQREIRLQAAITCQVIYLEFLLNDRLTSSGITKIYITDGDGLSRDFVVNMPVGVELDERLQAYLKKYKLVGKRFDIEQTSIEYNVDWISMHCAKVELTYQVQWINMHCIQVYGKDFNPIEIITELNNPYIDITVRSAFEVTSEIRVVVKITYDYYGNPDQFTLTIPISKKVSESVSFIFYNIDDIRIINIDPVEDYKYIY